MSKRNKHNDYYGKMQLDGDPLERRTDDGRFRPMLNSRERRELEKRNLQGEIVKLFLAGREIPQVAQELNASLEEVGAIVLHGGKDTRMEIIDRVIREILDVKNDRSRAEIAKKLGISVWQLRRLIEDDDFKTRYADAFVRLRNDPVIDEVKNLLIEDLLPQAFRTLQWELSEKAPPTVRQGARRDVFKLLGITAVEAAASDRREATEFLTQVNIQVNTNTPQVTPPEGYEETLAKYLPEVIEGEVVEPDPEADS